MARSVLARTISTFALLSTLASPAAAQEPGVSLEIERVLEAPPDQVLAWAQAALDEQQAHVRTLAKLDEGARRQGRSGEGLPCLTTSLTAAKALLEASQAAIVQAQAALDGGSRERAAFELRKIAVAADKSQVLRGEGEQCALGIGVQPGTTRVSVEGDAGTAEADLAAFPDDLLQYGFDPPATSPF